MGALRGQGGGSPRSGWVRLEVREYEPRGQGRCAPGEVRVGTPQGRGVRTARLPQLTTPCPLSTQQGPAPPANNLHPEAKMAAPPTPQPTGGAASGQAERRFASSSGRTRDPTCLAQVPSGKVPRAASPAGNPGALAAAGNHSNRRGAPSATPPPRAGRAGPADPKVPGPEARMRSERRGRPSPRPCTHRWPPAPPTGDTASGTTMSRPPPPQAARSCWTSLPPRQSRSWCHHPGRSLPPSQRAPEPAALASALPCGKAALLACGAGLAGPRRVASDVLVLICIGGGAPGRWRGSPGARAH